MSGCSMDNYELYHYGVKGMKWGLRRIPLKAERAYRSWRVKSHEKRAEHWKRKTEKAKVKNLFNPLYVRRIGKAQGHLKVADKHKEAISFIDWYLKNYNMIAAISDASVEIGKSFCNSVISYATKDRG